MPTYDYNCEGCGDIEIVHTMSEHPMRECPVCKEKLTQLVSDNPDCFTVKREYRINEDWDPKRQKEYETCMESREKVRRWRDKF